MAGVVPDPDDRGGTDPGRYRRAEYRRPEYRRTELGIDVGTSTTYAVAFDGGAGADPAHPLVLGAEGALGMPSAVTVDALGVARPLADPHADRRTGTPDVVDVVDDIVLRLGDPTPVQVGTTRITVSQLLTTLLTGVAGRLGDFDVRRTVLAVPPTWGPYRREALAAAAAGAGLPDPQTASSAEATARLYGDVASLPAGALIGVYHLGAHTCHAGLVELTAGGCRTLGEPDGVERLGGVDLDTGLARHVLAASRSDADPDRTLLRACRAARERLSRDEVAFVPDPVRGDEVAVTRSDLAAVAGPLVHVTVDMVERMLAAADVRGSELSALVLTGGVSRTPLVADALRERLGCDIYLPARPELVSAVAAAAWLGTGGQPGRPVSRAGAAWSLVTPTATPAVASVEPPGPADHEPAEHDPAGPDRSDGAAAAGGESGERGDASPAAQSTDRAPTGPRATRRAVALAGAGLVAVLATVAGATALVLSGSDAVDAALPPGTGVPAPTTSAADTRTVTSTVASTPASTPSPPPPPPAAAPPPDVEQPAAEPVAPTPRAAPSPAVEVPEVGASWHLQMWGAVDESQDVAVYELDGFGVDAATVARLQAADRYVTCYLNVGAVSATEPDRGDFPDELLGELTPSPETRWLDIRQADVLLELMAARMDMCAAKGFDAVDAGFVDGWRYPTGFDISGDDQLRYNRAIAGLARERGLAVGLRNNHPQVPELVDDFDFAVNDFCIQYDSCEAFLPFLEAGKPVFNLETAVSVEEMCAEAARLGLSSVLKPPDYGVGVLGRCD